MNKKYEAIKFEHRDKYAVIRLNRPNQRNAVDEVLAAELKDVLEFVGGHDAIRAVVLTGEGKGFCAGADMSQFGEELEPASVEAYLQTRYKPIIEAITTMPKPVIGAINGPAAGAGMAIGLACDFRVMSDTAAFYPAFIKIGLVPDAGSTWFLTQHLGYCRALEFLVSGKPLGADRCVVLGIANRVVRPDQLMQEAEGWARELAQAPTFAIGLTKQIAKFAVAGGLMDTFDLEAVLQRDAIASQDHLEGVAAFREKRRPNYQGN